MIRPCYLVIDPEHSGSISTRKLVIETAKFNVITAYSSVEAIQTLETYPKVNGIVMDSDIEDMPCSELISAFRRIRSDVTVIVVLSPRAAPCPEADHNLESFVPKQLLDLLQKLEPDQTAIIEKRDEDLHV